MGIELHPERLTHVQEAAFELADAATNPTGYADDGEESDRRAVKRDALRRAFLALIEAAF
jgi:hypothetical protein